MVVLLHFRRGAAFISNVGCGWQLQWLLMVETGEPCERVEERWQERGGERKREMDSDYGKTKSWPMERV